jgi:chromosome segregation ATPase
MFSVESKEARSRVNRWIEEGHSQLPLLSGVLNDYDRLEAAAESTERECQRLRGLLYDYERLRNHAEALERECDHLRVEVGRLRAEGERFRAEREAIAESLSAFMSELLSRLGPPQP